MMGLGGLIEMQTRKEQWDDEWYEKHFHAAVDALLQLKLRMGTKMEDEEELEEVDVQE